jgi:hypothetical protein
MTCAGLLTEDGEEQGHCELGEECTALELLDDYPAYRDAHPNRPVAEEIGGES